MSSMMGRNKDRHHNHRRSSGSKRKSGGVENLSRDDDDDDDFPEKKGHHNEQKRRRRHRNDDEEEPNYEGEDTSREGRKRHNKKKRRHTRGGKEKDDDSNDDDDSQRQRRKKHHHRHHHKEKKRHSHRSDRGSSDRRHDRKKRHDKKKKHKDKNEEERGKQRKDSKKESNKIHHSIVHVDKSKLYPLGEKLGKVPEQTLDPDKDYFAFHKHLWLYLYREHSNLTFDELSSGQSRDLFREFCKMYNAGKLETAYYEDELPLPALEECKTTRHKWGFNITDREDKNLQVLQEGVHKQTEYHGGPGSGGSTAPVRSQPSGNASAASFKASDLTTKHTRMTPEERTRERVANRRLREHVRAAEEELVGGRREGRERQIEKRKQVGERLHGAARERDAAMELNDDALYGGDGRNFQQELTASKMKKAKRMDQKQARITELENKEKQKQTAMLEMLGLSGKIQAGDKIKIAPRKDDG